MIVGTPRNLIALKNVIEKKLKFERKDRMQYNIYRMHISKMVWFLFLGEFIYLIFTRN